jgi:hypothetical protein
MPKIICFFSFAYRRKVRYLEHLHEILKQKEISNYEELVSLILEDNEEKRRILIRIEMQMAQKVTGPTYPDSELLWSLCLERYQQKLLSHPFLRLAIHPSS